MFRLAPFILLLMMRPVAHAQDVDTLRLPLGAAVQFVVEGQGRVVMVSGRTAYQRSNNDTVWTRLPHTPRSAALTYVRGDTMRMVSADDVVHTTTNAGRSWTQRLGVPNMVGLVASGRVGVAASDCDNGALVVMLYDIQADTVRYITSPIGCSDNMVVVAAKDACWIAAYGAQSTAAMKGDVWVVQNTERPIAEWEPEYVSGVAHVMSLRHGDIGLCRADTVRSVLHPSQRAVLPYNANDLGYPVDLGFDGDRWWMFLPSGVYQSSNGIQWQRNQALSSIANLRGWVVDSTVVLCSVDGFGPIRVRTASVEPYNQGLIDPVLAQPLLQLDDAVGYGDSWHSIPSRGLVVWGDATTTVRSKAYGDVEQRRTTVHRQRIWANGMGGAMSYDPATLEHRVECTGQPVFAVVPMGQHDVVWQGRSLKVRNAGQELWQTLMIDLVSDEASGQVLDIAGLPGHVVVIGVVFDTQSDAMALRSFTIDSTGDDVTGQRLITMIPADAAWQTLGVYSVDNDVVVWTGNGMYVSADKGQSWLLRPLPFSTRVRPTIAGQTLTVWAANPEGIWQSADRGSTWTRTTVPLQSPDVRSVATTSLYWHLLTPDGVIRVRRNITNLADADAAPTSATVDVHGNAITVATAEPSTITLVDVMGRIVASGTGLALRCHDVAAGLYHCIIATNRTSAVTSVVVTGW